MNKTGDFPDADERLNEAAAWRLRLTEAGRRTTPEFQTWLREPANQDAWDMISRSWNFFDDVAQAPEMIAAREAALMSAAPIRAERPVWFRRLVGTVAAALLLGLVTGGSYWWISRPDDYSTAIGERRVVTLSDGSKLSLDANSEVTVRYGKHDRSLHLLKGQARFDVAHDKQRPFSVVAGDQKVIATGTAFNIDMAGPKILVTLIEGLVVVLKNDGTAEWSRAVELRAGQQLKAAPAAAPEIAPANIQRVTAWTVGQLMFDDEPLASVIERVNRYGGTQIVIADARVGDMKISGVFNAGDAMGFVEIVTHYLPVKAVSEGPNTIALQSNGT
jgi:transmembrane sensor